MATHHDRRPRRAEGSPWRNWAGNQQAVPAAVDEPRTEEELVAVVRSALAAKQRIRVVGAGHSFTALALPGRGIRQITLDGYDRLVDHDTAGRRVTVQAGIRLEALSELLEGLGLALPNMGDVCVQSIAGAVSTGTHGTGAAFGSLSTQIVGLRIVTGTGDVIECDAEREPELFRCARVGLGALGILSTVTLQCVPAFALQADERPEPLDRVLQRFDEEADAHRHFEFYWFPHTDVAFVKRNDLHEGTPAPRSRASEWINDELLQNTVYGALCRLGRRLPFLVPRINRLIARIASPVVYSDASWKVFTSPRRVRFLESEWFLPRDRAVEALRRLRAWIESSGERLSFPVEVRFVQGDDIPLSPAFGGDRVTIAVHAFVGTPHQRYFAAVESLMLGLGGRPHWGKLHTRTAPALATLYPEWDAFQAVRSRVDPNGVFVNDHVEELLGPVR